MDESFYSSLPHAEWCMDLKLYQYKGYWFRLPDLQGTTQVLTHFKPLPSDIILASFPKTGTTWLKSILYSIVNPSSKESLNSHHPHELVPSLELQVYGQYAPSDYNFSSMGSTRIFNTHMPYKLLADTISPSGCRVIYVTRNPKDALVSYWHFVRKAKKFEEEPWPLEEAVERFCSGVVPYGPYHDHVLEYREESLKAPQRVFFITYEELKKDTGTQVKRLAEFLGFGFEEGEEEVDDIVKRCSIETLMNHEVNKSNDIPNWFQLPYNSVFRKGKVGDHKNWMNNEMIDRIDAITREKFHGSGFGFGI